MPTPWSKILIYDTNAAGNQHKVKTGIYLRNTENPYKFTHYAVKQVNKMSNKVHSKVKHNSLELSCSLYSQAQVLVSCVPSSTMFSASLLYACVDPLFLLEQVFNSTQKKVCLCTNMQELVQESVNV